MAFRALSDKLNPVIKPLMDSIKLEENEQLQQAVARTLARLLELCQSRTPCPNNKILKNICTFLCVDSDLTPKVNPEDLDGILILMQSQRSAEKTSGGKRNMSDIDQINARAMEVQRRGAVLLLKAVAIHFGENLPSKVPYLWDSIMSIQTIENHSHLDAVGYTFQLFFH